MSFENNSEKVNWQAHCTYKITSQKIPLSNTIMKKSNLGFSLVELMIVVGVLGGLSLVVMNITTQSTKSSTKFQFDTDVTLTTNEINAILSDPIKCLATLGTTASPVSINNGKYYISSHASAPANGYGNSGLKLTSYNLTGTASDGVLTIIYQNKNIIKGSTGSADVIKKINLYIEGAPGAITKCRSLSTSTTDIWTRGTATDANNIFYNGGVRTGDETQTTSCNSSTEGTQRYNKTIHKIEYCGYSAGPPISYVWKSTDGSVSLTKTVHYLGIPQVGVYNPFYNGKAAYVHRSPILYLNPTTKGFCHVKAVKFEVEDPNDTIYNVECHDSGFGYRSELANKSAQRAFGGCYVECVEFN